MNKDLIKFIIALFILINGFIAVIMFYPLPKALQSLTAQETLKVIDRNGTLLYEVLDDAKGRQTYIALNQIPKNLINAFLAAEDKNFYEHSGIDFVATLRAIWQNVTGGRVISGASTITQQLVRNVTGINTRRSVWQKLKESVFALRVSKLYDKDKILELYLNSVYFGGLAYGVEAASQQYFSKSAQNLDLAESSLLAGLPQSPNRYYPLKNFENAKIRQGVVLAAMQKNGFITNEELTQAKDEKIELRPTKQTKRAPHFVDFVLNESKENSLLTTHHSLRTTLDLGLQEKIENILANHLTFLSKYNIQNAATVILDVKTGEILAMVGSIDYWNSTIDGAVNVTTSLRQPGSSIKPLVYAAALEKGWTADTLINDEPIKFDTPEGLPYAPKNYDMEYRGSVTIAEALGQSLNIPAVKTLDFVGIQNFIKIAEDFGITSFTEDAAHYGLSLALGAGEVKLLELTSAFTTLANNGKHCLIQYIKKDPKLEIENWKLKICPQIIQPQTTQVISSILSDNNLRLPAFGEENPLNFDFPVAAKTGTTRNFRDNWTIGYTDDYAVGVWVGNSSGEFMEGVSGISGAAPIFNKIIMMLHESTGTQLSVDRLSTGDRSVIDRSSIGFHIITPFSNDQYLYDPEKLAESQKIELKASAPAEWFVDDKKIGDGEWILWQLALGKHRINAKQGSDIREVAIEVK